MKLRDPAPVEPPPPALLDPCVESCVFFNRINPDRWAEFGRCANPRSPLRGYPVRLGRPCRHFTTREAAARASGHAGG